MRFFLFILFLGLLFFLVQDSVFVFDWLQNATVLLLPMLMFVSACMVPFAAMLFFAALFGLLWDLSDLVIIAGQEGLGLGISMLLFGIFGSVMQGVRPVFLRGRWEVPLALAACMFFLYLFCFYQAINLRMGNFYFPEQLWLKLGLTTMLSVLTAPMMFYLLYRVAAALGSPVMKL